MNKKQRKSSATEKTSNISGKLKLILQESGIDPDAEKTRIKIPVEFFELLDCSHTINIVSDYDADGACSAVIAHMILTAWGHDVEVYIPDRVKDGYGFNVSIARSMRECDLVLTLDNGIHAHEAIDYCADSNIQVAIIDHHVAEYAPPGAVYVMNPNCEEVGGDYKHLRNLCAAQLTFVLLTMYDRHMEDEHGEKSREVAIANAAPWSTIATIADMVRIDSLNFRVTSQMFYVIRGCHVSPSFAALCKATKVDLERLTSADIGYKLGPTINAAGRMTTMHEAVDAMLTEDYDDALKQWRKIVKVNETRKKATTEGTDAAEAPDNVVSHGRAYICSVDAHPGVIGIIASRLKNAYAKPAIVIHQKTKVFSARSVEGFHINDALIQCREHLVKHGGHAMAAGGKVKGSMFEFARLFELQIPDLAEEKGRAVMTLRPKEINDMAAVVLDLPWGSGNPEPLFRSALRVESVKILKGKHSQLILSHRNRTFDAIFFNVPVLKSVEGDTIHMTYTLAHHREPGLYQLIVKGVVMDLYGDDIR